MINFIHNPMSEHDLQNLKFLLTASTETIADWFEHVDEDDVAYAFELLEMAKIEMVDQATELSDLSDASKYLTQLMIK